MMNYCKLFFGRHLRLAIIKYFAFIPDDIMLRVQYMLKFNRWPNFKNPKRFSEKIQVYKMQYRNPILPICVDKYRVREYIKSKGLGHILNILYGVYEDVSEINFDNLPQRFVLKITDGSGGNNVIICRDKHTLDESLVRKKMTNWLGMKDVNAGREWAYTGIDKSRIIAEQFLENDGEELKDYKFFCFNGRVYYIAVDSNHFSTHPVRNVYDCNWVKQDVSFNFPKGKHIDPKPENFNDMLEIAHILSDDFPHVRVDLYNIQGKVYFGELTFYSASGYYKFEPDDFDYKLGNLFTEYGS